MERKLSQQELSQLYDKLYENGVRILRKHDPCGFSNGKCSAPHKNCCENCEHLSENGCTIKELACKLWLCDYAKKRFPGCARKLEEHWDLAMKHNLIGERETKEETLERIAHGGEENAIRLIISFSYSSLV
jgi:hypothetical protein